MVAITLGEWNYIESDINNRGAITVVYEDANFLKLTDRELVLDVAFWKMRCHTPVNVRRGSVHAYITSQLWVGRAG